MKHAFLLLIFFACLFAGLFDIILGLTQAPVWVQNIALGFFWLWLAGWVGKKLANHNK